MYEGETSVVRDGTNGLRDVTYRIVFRNGEVEDKKVLRQDVRRQPVDQIVHVGTKGSSPTSRAATASGTGSRSARPAATGPSTPATATTAASSSASAPGRRTAAPACRHRQPRDPDRDRDQGPRRGRRLRRLAGLRREARPAALTVPLVRRAPVLSTGPFVIGSLHLDGDGRAGPSEDRGAEVGHRQPVDAPPLRGELHDGVPFVRVGVATFLPAYRTVTLPARPAPDSGATRPSPAPSSPSSPCGRHRPRDRNLLDDPRRVVGARCRSPGW